MRYHIYDSSKVDWLEESDDKNKWIEYREYNGEAEPGKDILVKETIDSDKFLKLVIKYHNYDKNRLFHIFYNPDKNYIITDCVINYKLDPKNKLDLVKRAANYYVKHFNNSLYDNSIIVNLLTPNGHLSPVIPSSMENQAICEMLYNDDSLNLGVSYIFDYKQLDFCLNENTRIIKNNDTLWTHNANIIVVNDFNEGNTLYKALSLYENFYGYVIGANVDVVLNSRSYLFNNEVACQILKY